MDLSSLLDLPGPSPLRSGLAAVARASPTEWERQRRDPLPLLRSSAAQLLGYLVYAIRQVVRWGGAWLRGRMRRRLWGGVVGSMVKPWPWMAMWWWNQQTVDRLSGSVRPPWDQGLM